MEGSASVLPRWVLLLTACACAVHNFALECAAISALLDLIALTQLVSTQQEAELQGSTDQSESALAEGVSVSVQILPLLTPRDLNVLNTRTIFYQVGLLLSF